MTSLILPSRPTRQPQQAVRIDWSNPITRGLVAAYIPRSGPRDATGALSTISDVMPRALPFGLSAPLNTGSYPVVGPFTFAKADSFSAFVLGLFTVSSSSNIAPVISVGQVGGFGNCWKFGPNGSGGTLGLTFAGVADYTTLVQFPASGSIAFSATPNTSARIFTDGVFRQQIAIGTMNSSSASRMALGQRGDAVADDTSGAQVALALYWNRALSDAEHASLKANPWQIIAGPQRRLMVPTTSAPAGAALSTAPGSYAISGNAAALRVTRRLATSAGAYALTGNATALRAARRLVAAPGAYVITGNTANLVKGAVPRALQVAAGSYVITGQPAGLRIARRLPAAPGNYVITGASTGAPVSGSMPRYADFTILQLSGVQGAANLGPDRIQQTVGLV